MATGIAQLESLPESNPASRAVSNQPNRFRQTTAMVEFQRSEIETNLEWRCIEYDFSSGRLPRRKNELKWYSNVFLRSSIPNSK